MTNVVEYTIRFLSEKPFGGKNLYQYLGAKKAKKIKKVSDIEEILSSQPNLLVTPLSLAGSNLADKSFVNIYPEYFDGSGKFDGLFPLANVYAIELNNYKTLESRRTFGYIAGEKVRVYENEWSILFDIITNEPIARVVLMGSQIDKNESLNPNEVIDYCQRYTTYAGIKNGSTATISFSLEELLDEVKNYSRDIKGLVRN